MLVVLTVSAMVVTGLNIWETHANQQLRADLNRITLQKAQQEAAARERLQAQAQDFCSRASLATENSIGDLVSEYYGTSTEVTQLIDSDCSDTAFFITHWSSYDAEVQSAFTAGTCQQDGWAISATLDGTMQNPLAFPITVTVEGNATSGGTTLGTGTDYLPAISPGESRVVNIHVSTNGYSLDACEFTDVSWWPAG